MGCLLYARAISDDLRYTHTACSWSHIRCWPPFTRCRCPCEKPEAVATTRKFRFLSVLFPCGASERLPYANAALIAAMLCRMWLFLSPQFGSSEAAELKLACVCGAVSARESRLLWRLSMSFWFVGDGTEGDCALMLIAALLLLQFCGISFEVRLFTPASCPCWPYLTFH